MLKAAKSIRRISTMTSLSSMQSVAELFGGASTSGASSSSYKLKQPSRLYLWQGDITTLSTDAIVNAANERMLGGGGVDGAIHRAAGPELKEECKKFPVENGARCPTGEARTTGGCDLPAKHVIHTVGPVYSKSNVGKAKELLTNAYRNSLKEAERVGAKSIAFPSISTGVYGYPIKEATEIAIQTADNFLDSSAGKVQQVVFCTFSGADKAVYEETFKNMYSDDDKH